MNINENTIYFVTSNSHKFHEVNEIFNKAGLPFLLEQKDLETIEIQAKTLKDIALFKLNSVKHKIYESFFIEDAGFFVDYPLDGFPGVYSSYVLQTIGNEGILKLIDDFDKSKAHFSTIIALYYKPSDSIIIFEGKIEGKVSSKIKGRSGFGFDPIFIPDIISDKTFAELTTFEKNKISHRSQAFQKLSIFLNKM
ncbi:MAG: RdgB/HAM1 family non-canonical purine NTP pyrophosphatase [Promethearchaeota archaeon]|jgi:XTP/dITP diphosphohydrolase